MSPTVAKFLERLLIVAVISALGFVADNANQLGPYGVAVGSAASMLLLIVGKLRPTPATPVAPSPPTPLIPSPPGHLLFPVGKYAPIDAPKVGSDHPEPGLPG